MFLLSLLMMPLFFPAQDADGSSTSQATYQCEIFCSDAIYDASGPCPNCEIPLRTVASIESKLRLGKTAAILIFPGVQVIDFSGPHEVLGAAGFRVVTVARSTKPLRTDEGLALIPDHDFASCPDINVLVLPGGKLYPDDESVAWIRDQAASEDVEFLLSVCNGLGWLYAAGLIDGLDVTTTANSIPRLLEADANYHVQTDRRVVDTGRIISSGGYTSGIDGALQVVARVRGRGAAELLATKLEHDWRPDSSMFPERRSYYLHLRTLQRTLERGVDALNGAPILSATCESDRAEMTWSLSPTISRESVISQIETAMNGASGWQRDDESTLQWHTIEGERWRVKVESSKPDATADEHLIRLLVSRQK